MQIVTLYDDNTDTEYEIETVWENEGNGFVDDFQPNISALYVNGEKKEPDELPDAYWERFQEKAHEERWDNHDY